MAKPTGSSEFTQLPAEIAGNLQLAPANGQRNPKGWQDELLQGVPLGQRDEVAIKLAGRYVALGLSDTEILALLLSWNDRNDPPMGKAPRDPNPEGWLREKIASARRMEAANKPLVKIVNPAGDLAFPEDGYTGVIADLADLYSSYTESPKSFYYFAALTFLGALIADKVTLATELRPQPRLYTAILGQSADSKKSTSIRLMEQFFSDDCCLLLNAHHGLGSIEGLSDVLKPIDGRPNPCCIVLDELRVLVDKATIKSSTLLPALCTLFEQNSMDNSTKGHTFKLRQAYVSMVGACTTGTYEAMWTPAFLNIGFTNRLWLVVDNPQQRVALPREIPQKEKSAIKNRLGKILDALNEKCCCQMQVTAGNTTASATLYQPVRLALTPEAGKAWNDYYLGMARDIYSRRLDTYAVRLMVLFSVSEGNLETVEKQTVDRVIKLLEHQRCLRQLYDPVDAEGTMARMEEKIRRILLTRGGLSKRDLQTATNAWRTGLWFFDTALTNLVHDEEVLFDRGSQLYYMAAIAN